MMSDVSNTYKYTDIMEDIISSVEVDQSNVPTDNTPETPQPTAEPQKYNPPKISLSEFNQLQDGISYEEAVEIIGSSGSLMSESSLGGISTKMYTWEGEGDIGANANAMFQNGKLISKAQYGLK